MAGDINPSQNELDQLFSGGGAFDDNGPVDETLFGAGGALGAVSAGAPGALADGPFGAIADLDNAAFEDSGAIGEAGALGAAASAFSPAPFAPLGASAS